MGSSTKKAKIVDRGSLFSEPESTSCKLQCDPYLFSVACSWTSCPFWGKLVRTGKVSSSEKAKIVDRVSLCNAPESTCSKVQYEPYLFSVACSKVLHRKTKIVDSGSLCSARENTGSKLHYEPYLFSVACS